MHVIQAIWLMFMQDAEMVLTEIAAYLNHYVPTARQVVAHMGAAKMHRQIRAMQEMASTTEPAITIHYQTGQPNAGQAHLPIQDPAQLIIALTITLALAGIASRIFMSTFTLITDMTAAMMPSTLMAQCISMAAAHK